MSLLGDIGKAIGGGIAGSVGGAIGGAIGGAPGAAIGRSIGGMVGKGITGGGSGMPGSGNPRGAGGGGGEWMTGGFMGGALPSQQLMKLPAGPPSVAASFLDPGVPGPGIFSPETPPKGYHLSKQPPYHFVRNRRMNVMNHRAAMRAIRRIKGARKMLQKIERQLPKQRTHRRAPAHHHHPRGGVV